MLSHGASATSEDIAGCSPLHFACAAGHADMVAPLLSRGADIWDTQPGSSKTPLHMVCQGPEWGEQVRPSLPYLTSFLAQWHVGVPQNTAAYRDIVNILVSCDTADINARDSKKLMEIV
ncbi:TPA: hypothetical protein ACH3X1_004731 [Trebouxia sp. C0004]